MISCQLAFPHTLSIQPMSVLTPWRRRTDATRERRTVIAIAHRLSTVRNVDRIVVMQAGRVVQDGAPELLMGRDGLYRDLIEREITRLSKHRAAA